ncbi:hypothetical protein SAMN06295945_0370 [Polynucleobacter meluiroseus]|uniref:ATP-grasp domain-containing protein n=1 Tax=Polynucleobacter meluiroseus TaxID=1938814 RepID=A0A240DZJ3_9BURK|nr:D-alanine--D-alanine ligase [Polynucleobacter meluiroseus]SNX28050.1 hypothetical protein SAMN06295945_0370 [Polynucleobacter meluiroseus]
MPDQAPNPFLASKQGSKVLSFFEFWPAWLFYLPVYIFIGLLMMRYRSFMLPTAVNPRLDGGKFCGESKHAILQTVEHYLPEYAAVHCAIEKRHDAPLEDVFAELQDQLEKRKISYPLVAKPDLGCRGAGVNLIHSPDQLYAYLQAFPNGESLICQELISYEAEAGIFYCRLPHEETGRIISLTLKYFPVVIGDSKHTLHDLIMKNPRASALSHLYLPRLQARLGEVPVAGEKVSLVFAGNHSKGAIFKDGALKISQTLTETFDGISKRLPSFYFGRFDVRYASFEQLERGNAFQIVEINGASSESTHIWDANCSLMKAYRDLFTQFHLLFMIGEYNVRHGAKKQAFKEFVKAHLHDKKLSTLYPGTH